MSEGFQNSLDQAAKHLIQHDRILAEVVERAGLPTFRPHKNYYQALCDSIISQQLSVKAAASIEKRFKDLFGGGEFPPPEAILNKSIDELRSVGLSNAKANYIRDLAQHVLDGKLRFDKIDSQTNEEIIVLLTDVKGIGEWTAHMFLMFAVGRLDVLPVGDLGIRNGVTKLYGFKDVATPQQIKEIAEKYHWHPYESVASWYIWHSLDNQPAL